MAAAYARCAHTAAEPSLVSKRLVGAFVFSDAWRDRDRFGALLRAFRGYGINALMTESEEYEVAAIEQAHDLGLRFYAGVACFSDHATNFRQLGERPGLWPVL